MIENADIIDELIENIKLEIIRITEKINNLKILNADDEVTIRQLSISNDDVSDVFSPYSNSSSLNGRIVAIKNEINCRNISITDMLNSINILSERRDKLLSLKKSISNILVEGDNKGSDEFIDDLSIISSIIISDPMRAKIMLDDIILKHSN